MIKFIPKKEEGSPFTFSDVPVKQFFVPTIAGGLWFKTGRDEAHMIVNRSGRPEHDFSHWTKEAGVERIIEIEKIKF